MGSPEREKHLAALARLKAFCEAHNKKANLVEQIQNLLFKCDVGFLRRTLKFLEKHIKEKK